MIRSWMRARIPGEIRGCTSRRATGATHGARLGLFSMLLTGSGSGATDSVFFGAACGGTVTGGGAGVVSWFFATVCVALVCSCAEFHVYRATAVTATRQSN